MIPEYNKIHNKSSLNGIYCSISDLKRLGYGFIKEGIPYEKKIGNFLLDWSDDKDYILANTSGSTGKPKTIKVKKQAMVNSAIATGDFLKLEPGSKALHCLPLDFIAGKMMIVRALILGHEMDIVEPLSNPLENLEKNYDFCAMVPLQVENSIHKLNQIKTLIIGGAPVSNSLFLKLQELKTKVHETYGMTETVTHIALRQLNKFKSTSNILNESYFKILPNISISQDDRDCLTIEAPHLFDGKVVSNDIVKLHSTSTFEFLGRHDNIINSGGVKLFPEQIEAKLSKAIKKRFFISSEADEVLGERVILIIEGESNELPKSAFDVLDKYEKPKFSYAVSNFIETTSGKINRKKTCKLLKG